jgi:hypothetical protein
MRTVSEFVDGRALVKPAPALSLEASDHINIYIVTIMVAIATMT